MTSCRRGLGETREHIVQATMALHQELGLPDTTVSAIAKRRLGQ